MAPLNVIYALSLDGSTHRYVGQTSVGAKKRFRGHKTDTAKGCRLPVHEWMRKHVPTNIVLTVLEVCETPEALSEREIFWIASCRTFKQDGFGGMNLTRGGHGSKGMLGWQHSAETKARIGAGNKGKVHTSEQIAVLIAANTGRVHTAESRLNMSLAKRAPRTPEHCANLAAALKGQKQNAERAIASAAHFAAVSGLGLHTRWHTNLGLIKQDCTYCVEALKLGAWDVVRFSS